MTRNTVQRQIILEILQKYNAHPTVEDVYQEIHKHHPTISKATVYRNLRQLAENGEALQILMPDEPERFDKRTDRHYHFRCGSCGIMYDVDIDYPKEMDEAVSKKYEFDVYGHDIVFRGLCASCKGNVTK